MRKLLSVLLILCMLTTSLVSALDNSNLVWGTIKVNGDVVNDGDVLAVEEGQTLNVRIGLSAAGAAGASDIEVEAEIFGYEYDDYESLEDSTHVMYVTAGTTKYADLSVALPIKLDKDTYTLRLRIADKNTEALTKDISLAVEPKRNAIDIADVAISPGTTIKAGKPLLVTVLLENYGEKDQKDVKVSVEIPALGVADYEYVDAVQTDNNNVDSEDVPEMFLQIPATAAAGEYDVKVTAKYDVYETVTKTFKITVLANEMYQESEKLVLAVGPETQNVEAGKTATYAIALTNAGSTSKAYLLDATAGSEWATISLSDSLVVLEPGKNKVVYVEAKVSDKADAGEHTAVVNIKSGSEILQSIPLKANVVAATSAATGSEFSLRNGLEIALIVLVVILVIIGLIIGFSRLKKDDEVEGKNYY